MYSSVNKIAHKYDLYPLLNSILYFVKKTFIKKTNLPFISIFLFILVIILNSIQYAKNDTNFLQDNTTSHKKHKLYQVTLSNSLLYLYSLIGINTFISSGIHNIIFFMLTYFCLALIEMNIGHVAVLFLLLVDIMFNSSITGFNRSLCVNDNNSKNFHIYCCGSFLQYMTIGFVLYLLYKNLNSKLYKGLIILITLSTFIIIILDDFNFSDNKRDDSEKICNAFLWHASNLLLGIFSGIVLGN